MRNIHKICGLPYFSVILIILLFGCDGNREAGLIKPEFIEAEAIWPKGKQFEKNLTYGFRSEFVKPEEKTFLRIAGSSLYRIYLNNEFIGHGPARAGHGYYRMDEWDLSNSLKKGNNILTIEVTGYNVNSFYLLDQPAFLQAEVISGNQVISATRTDNKDFAVFHLNQRIQKVPRYSFQRPFIEYYRLSPKSDSWKASHPQLSSGETEGSMAGQEALSIGPRQLTQQELETVSPKSLITRRIPYPEFTVVQPKSMVATGSITNGHQRENYWRDRAVVNIGPKLGGFVEDELELNPAIELQEMETESFQMSETSVQGLGNGNQLPIGNFDDKEFAILDFGTNLTGFIGTRIQVIKPSRLYVTFDEILQNNDVNFKRLGTIAALTYDLEPGSYSLESMEPYTFRYLKVIVASGEVEIEDIYLREYANPDIKRASFASSDERLNRIFNAGIETFRQNAVDIFMDCPHRERAGWLCDSYFTARVANDVSGNTLIEKNFLENYLLPESYDHLPAGMLPMCYPADHSDSVFIPNWAMWFVVELEEYLDRSGDQEMVDALETKVMGLLDYFTPFKNKDGLLENLESWIFIEWSAANRFVQDVNYPTNMLFAQTLEIAGRLYDKPGLIREAEEIRKTIREQSYNGQFFVDNAVRCDTCPPGHDGENQCLPTNNTTEVCQYYAFYFNIATPETYPELWNTLINHFGPSRSEQDLFPEVYPANSFVGNYLRIELLSRYNLQAQLMGESINYFDYMAQETGTLWENISASASCNHGFASHVVHVLYRDVLGIANVDKENHVLSIQFSDLDLEQCEGQIPIGDQMVKLSWKREENSISYSISVPENYTLDIINNTNLQLIEK